MNLFLKVMINSVNINKLKILTIKITNRIKILIILMITVLINKILNKIYINQGYLNNPINPLIIIIIIIIIIDNKMRCLIYKIKMNLLTSTINLIIRMKI
jgi:hypothetical protein